MCGIVGTVNSFSYDYNKAVIDKCIEKIRHRGPDACGFYNYNNIYFGHTRLSIIDSSQKANQPFISEDRNFVITYNGEIFNYEQIKQELIGKNYKFHSKSDTEVVINAYKAWGINCLKKLDGMFAFCIFDKIKNALFLARDILGEKPLYYSNINGFSFSSELSCFEYLNKNNEFSIVGLNHFLAIGYTLHPYTIYKEVFCLPPSSYLEYSIEKKEYSIHKYFNYADKFTYKTPGSLKDLSIEVRRLLSKAVSKRLVGDSPFGIFLSGGIDSSSVATLAKENSIDLKCFTVGFNSKTYDESYKALKLSKVLGATQHTSIIDNIAIDSLNNYISLIDYATFDNSSYPLYILSINAKKHVKFVLGGDGADEIFGGYATYKADRVNKNIKHFIPLIKCLLREELFNSKNDKVGIQTKLKRFIKGIDKNESYAHYKWRLLFSETEIIQLLGSANKELIEATNPYKIFKEKYNEVTHLNILDQHLYVDTQTWLTDNILIKIDRNSMLAGLELRSPFLDKELISFVASCPVKYKKNKILLKEAMRGVLPKELIYQSKSGFNSPIGNWLKDEKDEFRSYTKHLYLTKYNLNL